MRGSSAVTLLASLGLALSANPAVAAEITADQREDYLAVFVACEKDPSLKMCGPFLPALAYVKTLREARAKGDAQMKAAGGSAVSPPTPAPILSPASGSQVAIAAKVLETDFEAARGQRTASAVEAFASGHGSGAAGQAIATPASPKFTVSTSTDTKTASVTFNVDLSTYAEGKLYNLSFTGQTPVGQDSTYQNLATLDGLTKSTSLEIKLDRLFKNEPTQHLNHNAPEYQTACVGVLNAMKAAQPGLTIDSDLYAPYACDAAAAEFILKGMNLPAAANDPLAAVLRELDASTAPLIDWMLLVSGHAKVGYESHSFYDLTKLDPATFDPTKSKPSTLDRTPFDLGLSATYVFGKGFMSIGGSLDFQRAYMDGGAKGQTKTLCPVQSVAILTCVNGFVGHPLETDKYLLATDYRYINTTWLKIPFGIDPTFTWDMHSGAYGFQLPIYLTKDSTQPLSGGLMYDWTSDTHHSVVGIFVTSAFCVLPGYSECAAPKSGGGGS